MLGHKTLESTQIYTHVSIRTLQRIHEESHPAKLVDKDELYSSLAAEAAEEEQTN